MSAPVKGPAGERTSPFVWARSVKGALGAAQHLALLKLAEVSSIKVPALDKPVAAVRRYLEMGDPEVLSLADKKLLEAKVLPEVPGKAAALLDEARKLICHGVSYAYASPEPGVEIGELGQVPVGEDFDPQQFPVRFRFLDSKGSPLSGPVFVDEDEPPAEAEDAPTPLPIGDYQRLYEAHKQRVRRLKVEDIGVEAFSIVERLGGVISRAGQAWEKMEVDLKGDKAVKLLRQFELPGRLEEASALVEQLRTALPVKRDAPGRPPGSNEVKMAALDSRKDEVVADLRAEMPKAKLALKYKVSGPTLTKWMKRNGLDQAGALQVQAGPSAAKKATAAKVGKGGGAKAKGKKR